MADTGSKKDYVVVLHGIARTWRSMRRLARYFERNGYPVLNVGYPSTRLPLEALVEHIHQKVVPFNRDPSRKIHFVGYSLGGLLARGLIHKHRPTTHTFIICNKEAWMENPHFFEFGRFKRASNP